MIGVKFYSILQDAQELRAQCNDQLNEKANIIKIGQEYNRNIQTKWAEMTKNKQK